MPTHPSNPRPKSNPFGSSIKSRSYSAGSEFRFGYGGHVKDDEIKGNGSHLSFGEYGYDSRIVRRWNVDPLKHEVPECSPFSAFANNPIIYVDASGLYPIYIITRSYAPFKIFGVPGDEFYGDNRGHSLEKGASYRTSVLIYYETERKQTLPIGGRSFSENVRGTKKAISQTKTDNRKPVGNNIDVHSYGNNAAQAGSWDIDQFTKINVTSEGDIKKDHILNLTGTISGDNFPNQESLIYDSKGNTLWLGNYATSGKSDTGPTMDLAGENENEVHISISLRIKVNKDGVFQGVMQKGENGKETLISVDEWNKQKSDEKK